MMQMRSNRNFCIGLFLLVIILGIAGYLHSYISYPKKIMSVWDSNFINLQSGKNHAQVKQIVDDSNLQDSILFLGDLHNLECNLQVHWAALPMPFWLKFRTLSVSLDVLICLCGYLQLDTTTIVSSSICQQASLNI